jgi:hypothetical protein
MHRKRLFETSRRAPGIRLIVFRQTGADKSGGGAQCQAFVISRMAAFIEKRGDSGIFSG